MECGVFLLYFFCIVVNSKTRNCFLSSFLRPAGRIFLIKKKKTEKEEGKKDRVLDDNNSGKDGEGHVALKRPTKAKRMKMTSLDGEGEEKEKEENDDL